MAESIEKYEHYYVPDSSHWPIVGSVALGCIMIGIANIIHGHVYGHYFFGVGGLILVYMLFGWFGTVARESLQGLYSKQMDRSFRWGMAWFIFSEVMFFAAFFGTLFYARNFSVPWLGGEGAHGAAGHYLWQGFSEWWNSTPPEARWPLLNNPDPKAFVPPHTPMEAWGLPAINTLILLTSGATITWAHWGLMKNKKFQLVFGLFLTIALGVTFLILQGYEYAEAYEHFGLRLDSGIYGTTFFMLTGFHGAHVTLGTIMLLVIFFRSMKGHFKPDHHFAFEGVAWYWHFVDVVWLFLFVLVYWL